MSYKVNYYTLALFEDGHVGNIEQSRGHFFTDVKIEDIPETINSSLKSKNLIARIIKVEDVGGRCL